jgi:uncharacterized protein (DUF1501 family)
MGGFDTHANQAVDHPNLLRALGGAVNAFYDDSPASPPRWGTPRIGSW